MIEAKAFRTFIRIYSLSKNGRLSTNIKLILPKALIRSAVTYAWPTWEPAADIFLLKLQRLQKKASLEILQGAYKSAIFTRFSTFLM
jgi:hypothetical protein